MEATVIPADPWIARRRAEAIAALLFPNVSVGDLQANLGQLHAGISGTSSVSLVSQIPMRQPLALESVRSDHQ